MSDNEESNDPVENQDTNENSVRKNSSKLEASKMQQQQIFFLQNESSSNPSGKETDTAETNRTKRFEFLLKQTEIFSHFMPGSTSSKITPEKKKGRKKEEKKDEPLPEGSNIEIDPAE